MLKSRRGARRVAAVLIALVMGYIAGADADTSGTNSPDTQCWAVFPLKPIEVIDFVSKFGTFSSAGAALDAAYAYEAPAMQQGVALLKSEYGDAVLNVVPDYYDGTMVLRTYWIDAWNPNLSPSNPNYSDIANVGYFEAMPWGSSCQSQYVVKLSNVSGSNSAPPVTPDPPTYTPLTVLGPSGTYGGGLVTSSKLIARVYDQNGQVVPNINVQLTLKAIAGSGGHAHDAGDPYRPLGALNGQPSTLAAPEPLARSTGSDGEKFTFTYTTPEPSGDYQIVATCTNGVTCTQQGPDTVWVGVQNLEPLSPNPPDNIYHLVGMQPSHPDNHYLTEQATEAVTILASLYHGEFPNEPAAGLALNDASLVRGGLFDIYYDYWDKNGIEHKRTQWWVPPHHEHRLGIVVDVRANPATNPTTAIPEQNFARFESLVTHVLGGNYLLEDPGTPNQHFHVRLLGVKG